MLTPYAALPGFNLDSDICEIAGHYRLNPRRLKYGFKPDEKVLHARDALFWKLTRQRNLSPQRAGDMLKVSGKAVREAANRHAHRIAEFRAQMRAPAQQQHASTESGGA